jgi:hypothetical protein
MSRNDKPTGDAPQPGPSPLPPNRRSSFSQNPSFSTLFGGGGAVKGSPPRTSPDATFQRRFSWSYPPPKESTSAIDDSEEPTSPTAERRDSELGLGRRLSTTASSIKEALGFSNEPTSPRGMKTVLSPTPISALSAFPDADNRRIHFNRGSLVTLAPFPPPVLLPLLPKVSASRANPANRAGGDIPPAGRTGTQSFIQRRRASFGKTRKENDPHADRMLQGHFSID